MKFREGVPGNTEGFFSDRASALCRHCVSEMLVTRQLPRQPGPEQARLPARSASRPCCHAPFPLRGHSLLSVQLSFIITLVHSCCSSSSSRCCCCCCCRRQLIEKSAANKVFRKFARPHSSPPSHFLFLSFSLSPAMMRFFCRFCTLPFAASVFHNLACRSAQFSHILTAP